MLNLDQYAYLSNLSKQDSLEKLIFSLLTLIVCIWANEPVISIIIMLIMGGITVFRGGTSLKVFLKLLSIPSAFLLISVIAIGIDVTKNPEALWGPMRVLNSYIGLSVVGLPVAVNLFFKALGAVSCLYYLILSTPIVDLLSALERLGVPSLLREMMGLIYRFIFVFIETAQEMHLAQRARLGYTTLRGSYRSLGTLISNLLVQALRKSEALYTALEARGYQGELRVLEDAEDRITKGYLGIIGTNLGLVFITLGIRAMGRG